MARRFGATWWGRAWLDALENRARFDANRLPRGRTYARHDRVQTLRIRPGEVTAFVRGSRPAHYRVLVRVRTHGDDEWARVVDVIAGRAGHAAALLDGDLDPAIAADAADAGVDLLPGPGDLVPHCSCPDRAVPCKHAAAVCYLVADVLDDDPFALFALRGRPRDDLLAELRDRRRAPARTGGPGEEPEEGAGPVALTVDPGTPARAAWTSWRARTGSPPPARSAPIPPHPGAPAAWPTDPPAGSPFTADGLHALASDAAGRAWAQLRGEGDSALATDRDADVIRRAAAVLDSVPAFTALARSVGVTPAELTRRASAWRHGGAEALAALDEEPWRPPVATMAAARRAVADAVGAAGAHPPVTVTANRLTVGAAQLRLSRRGRWFRFEKRGGRWEVTAPPADAPYDLLT